MSHAPEFGADYAYLVRGQRIGDGSDSEPLLNVSTVKVIGRRQKGGDFQKKFRQDVLAHAAAMGIDERGVRALGSGVDYTWDQPPNDKSASVDAGVSDPAQAMAFSKPTDAEVEAMVSQYANVDGAPSAEQIDAAVTQYRDTERAYGGREAWEKARDAGRTKLTYGQWVQVRTPNFKQWIC